MSAIIIEYLLAALFSAIPAVGFGMVFNASQKYPNSLCFWWRYRILLKKVFDGYKYLLELATFIASTIVGIVAFYWSRKYIVPRPVYTIASIIPMLPGTYAFAAIINLITMNAHGVTPELIATFVDNSLKTIIVLGGIGFGLALPSLYYIRYNRPII